MHEESEMESRVVGHSLCAMAMTPERGIMRLWVCWCTWWDAWMLVRVLTGGRPPPDTEICEENAPIVQQND